MSKGSEALTKQRDRIQGLPGTIVIKTPEELEVATEEVKTIKAYIKAVKEYWDPLCDNGHKTWKALTGRRKEFLDPANNMEKLYKLGIARYFEADRAQKAAEHKKRVEAEQKAAEDKRLGDMTKLEDIGALKEAEHIANQPLDVRPVAEPVETKVEGMSTSERWSAEVVDFGALLEFCAKDPRWRHLVAPVQKELNKLAVAQKEMFDIPGVKAKSKLIPSIRS